MAVLLTPPVLDAQFNRLFDFIQESWNIARKARLVTGEPPPNPDAYTLDTTPFSAEEANIAAVLDRLKKIQDLQVKVDDAISEMTFAIRFLEDRARRVPPLPSAIAGPPFGVNTSPAP